MSEIKLTISLRRRELRAQQRLRGSRLGWGDPRLTTFDRLQSLRYPRRRGPQKPRP
jgi:hypothetical protein